MIFIQVDEAYAFDYLSILEIKEDKDNTDKIKNLISLQITENKLQEILNSDEYKNLKIKNLALWLIVEKARYGKKQINAKVIDNANMDRHQAKQSLQQKFFFNNLTEKKT